MTGYCIKSISPDAITGMIFAMEGMQDTIVLLNGPMGCRFYHSSTSGFLMRRPLLYLPAGKEGKRVPVDYNYLNDWFFRQERVPCTYLDGHDYVYGTGEKAAEALAFIAGHIDFSILAIVNSPGAALIGDDLYGIARRALPDRPVVYLESPGYSSSFEEGYSSACLEMLKVMLPRREENDTEGTGTSVSKNDTEGTGPGVSKNDTEGTGTGVSKNDTEGTGTGVSKNSTKGTGSSVLDNGISSAHFISLESSAAQPDSFADSNGRHRPGVNLLGLSIWHRYCEGDVRELRRLFDLCGIDVRTVLCADCPASDLKNVPDADLNVVAYPQAGLESAQYLQEKFGTPYYVCDTLPMGFAATEKMFRDISRLLGTPDAAFLEQSECARALAWNKINGIYQMYGKPKGVTFHVAATPSLEKALASFLTDYLGMEEAPFEQAELLFSDANRISERALLNDAFCGIEIALPGMGYTDLTVKTQMGLEGSLFLIEQVLNGIMSK